jgi:hypothetical protein
MKRVGFVEIILQCWNRTWFAVIKLEGAMLREKTSRKPDYGWHRNVFYWQHNVHKRQRNRPLRRQLSVLSAVRAFSQAARLVEEIPLSGLPGYRKSPRVRRSTRSETVAGANAPRHAQSQAKLCGFCGFSLDVLANASHMDHCSTVVSAGCEVAWE